MAASNSGGILKFRAVSPLMAEVTGRWSEARLNAAPTNRAANTSTVQAQACSLERLMHLRLSIMIPAGPDPSTTPIAASNATSRMTAATKVHCSLSGHVSNGVQKASAASRSRMITAGAARNGCVVFI